jgi:hypothetical protein
VNVGGQPRHNILSTQQYLQATMLREEVTAHVAGVRLCEETRNNVYNYQDATLHSTYKLQWYGVNSKVKGGY